MNGTSRFALALLVIPATTLSVGRAQAQHVAGPRHVAPIPQPVVLPHEGRFQARLASVGDDMFIAGQPTEAALLELHRDGVTTVINLRTPEEMKRAVSFDEEALVKTLGITYVYLPVRGTPEFPYAPATLRRFSEAMESARGKVLLHCTVAWRASHLWAAYLIQQGMSVDTALTHTRLINLMDRMHGGAGRQPVEEFLDRDLPQLHGGASRMGSD
jgi:uncharacterized protein (TIGR01244 family)